MKKATEFKNRSLRRDRNAEVVRRMRNGDQLSSFNSYASWYPPRPTIEKDRGALEKLYGADVVSLNQLSSESDSLANLSMRPLRLA